MDAKDMSGIDSVVHWLLDRRDNCLRLGVGKAEDIRKGWEEDAAYFHSAAGEAKSPQAQYNCMDLDAIKALPVDLLAAPHCLLILWATAPMLPQALEVMAAWRFKFITAGSWAKQSSTGEKWAFGTGYVLRSAAEFYLVGRIGQPVYRSRSVRNLIVAPVREHSRKPDQMHTDIERLVHGPYAELFARQTRPGWSAWGNQTDKFGECA